MDNRPLIYGHFNGTVRPIVYKLVLSITMLKMGMRGPVKTYGTQIIQLFTAPEHRVYFGYSQKQNQQEHQLANWPIRANETARIKLCLSYWFVSENVFTSIDGY